MKKRLLTSVEALVLATILDIGEVLPESLTMDSQP